MSALKSLTFVVFFWKLMMWTMLASISALFSSSQSCHIMSNDDSNEDGIFVTIGISVERIDSLSSNS